jgi:hypothetical protein
VIAPLCLHVLKLIRVSRCFFQLNLPLYPSKEQLSRKLFAAMAETGMHLR